MARIRSANLEGKTARLKLPVARQPVWVKVGPGCGLGYRRTTTGGTWVVRIADGRGGYRTEAFATADDFEEPNRNTVMTFWEAQDRARTLARSSQSAADNDGKPVTVAQALNRYQANLETRGGDRHNVSRVQVHLPAALAAKSVTMLTARDLSRWRDGLKKNLTPSSVNRTTKMLKAALNLAADHDEHISNRQSWENGLAENIAKQKKAAKASPTSISQSDLN
jgi:hypothetical protein